ncbi:PREDICTED: tumor suppressor p53-binding protein 1-like [Ceratosolen solmsi marchali]|uniref:Tumor suppressor p53-binding protein 1-like n=1 Tax=Ceratosolen solmsi marchali TaxID=326594 RepID=A0AAJ6YDQ2_9HYME|nr:PREDICTED: tumor suppressor p53-binding protein 1-like [Ceratosolen solmsi marchali]
MNMEVAYYKAAVKPNCTELIKINENEEIILDMSHEEISSKDIDSVNANCKGVNIQNDTNFIKDREEDILDIHKSNYNIQNKKNDFLNDVSDNSDNVELIEDSNQELDSQIANDPIHLPKSESSIVVTISDSDNSMIDDRRKNDNLRNNKLNRENIEISQIEKVINFNIKLKCLLSIDKNAKEIYQKQIINAICEPNSAPISHQKIANSSTSTCLADISSSDNKDSSPASTSAFQLHNLQPSRLSFVSSISSSSSASCTVPLTTTKSNNETQFSYRPWPLKYFKKNANRLNSEDKQNWDAFEKLTKEWKNSHIIISTIINFLNNEIFFPDNGSCDNGNSDLTENNQILRSSTPEIEVNNISNVQPTKKNVRNDKVNKQLKNSKIIKTSKEIETNTISELDNEFLEKEVFAKWSDNNYYPGKVCAIIKTKYKVNFFDGKTKLLLPDFILPINKNLETGSSVYTYSNDDKYASSGLIINIEKKAQLIREQILKTSIVTTIPQQLSYITLDNVLSSKRRSKKTTVLNIHTTEFQKSSIDRSNKSKPSVSGMQNKLKQKIDNDNRKMIIYNHKGWTKFLGVQNEIIDVLQNEIIKEPLSKVKGKSRYPKKVESSEDLEILGPIPEANSNIFKGMTFILSCVSLKTLIRYQVASVNNDSNSESGTENEEEWVKRPFLRYRLQTQITAGGGKVYDHFEDIPSEEYLHTKHITNLPNLSKNSLLCLSVGIRSYNHQWVIRSCLQNKAIEPAEEELPAGWSLDKQAYIDIYQRPKNRPLEHTIIAIPLLECGQTFVEFWKKICENAGAAVQILENPDKSFMEVTIILANVKCPLWVIEQAKNWHIPILSTIWLVQCLIEGKLCSFDTKQVYKSPLSDSSF